MQSCGCVPPAAQNAVVSRPRENERKRERTRANDNNNELFNHNPSSPFRSIGPSIPTLLIRPETVSLDTSAPRLYRYRMAYVSLTRSFGIVYERLGPHGRSPVLSFTVRHTGEGGAVPTVAHMRPHGQAPIVQLSHPYFYLWNNQPCKKAPHIQHELKEGNIHHMYNNRVALYKKRIVR